VSTPPDKLSGGVDTRVHGGGHGCPGAPDNGVLVTTTEPSIEPSLPPPAPDRATRPYSLGGGGDLVYSKTLTPAQRKALGDRLAALARDQAQQILDELSGRMAIAQVKNPIRYCATLIERMQRGEFLPELGLKVVDARQAEVERVAALARVEKASVGESRSGPQEIPVRFREAMERIFSRSSVHSKKVH